MDRRAPSFAQVQGQINRKFGITGQTTLTFLLPSGTSIPVNNDNDLRRAITEAAMSGEYSVNLTVRGGYRAGGQAQAARPQAAQPVSQPRPQQTQPQQPASAALRQPAPSPAQAGVLFVPLTCSHSSQWCTSHLYLTWSRRRWTCQVCPSRSWRKFTCCFCFDGSLECLSLPTYHCWF